MHENVVHFPYCKCRALGMDRLHLEEKSLKQFYQFVNRRGEIKINGDIDFYVPCTTERNFHLC